MRIVVCIKEVPDTTDVRIDDENGTLIREGVPSIVNPFDLYALETALKAKDNIGAEVVVLSMGPPQAEKSLRECIAMGADRAILLSDRAFAGSDTHATSYTLSLAVGMIGDVDLILVGKQAIDGDTGQVGPGIAEFLGLPQAMYVYKIDELTTERATVRQAMERGYKTLEIPFPAVISIVKGDEEPRLPSLRGMMMAKRAEIELWTANELKPDTSWIGLSGSPTRVMKIFAPQKRTDGEKWEGEPDELASKLAQLLEGISVS